MLMRASCVVLLWLLSVSFAHAATTQGQRASATKCDEHSATLKKLIRHARSFGGPLAKPPQRALFGLPDVNARSAARALGDLENDDDRAIQNDAPAANIDANGRSDADAATARTFSSARSIGIRVHAHSPRSRLAVLR
jgi:hypothetical protein